VHFDGDEVGSWIGSGNFERGLAHARADLDHERRNTSEHSARVDQRLGVGDAVLRVQRFNRALLRGCRASLPEDVAPDWAGQAALGCDAAMVPLTGEDGLAL
jgi:hypothetical protein